MTPNELLSHEPDDTEHPYLDGITIALLIALAVLCAWCWELIA